MTTLTFTYHRRSVGPPAAVAVNSYRRRDRIFGTVSAAAALVLLLCQVAGSRAADSEVRIGADDIGGTVAGSRGPEAGVWVIAETQDFQTRFAKIVVTDEASPIRPKSTPAPDSMSTSKR